MKTKTAHSEKQKRPNFERWCRLQNLYYACLDNASSLQDEAKLLLDNGHFARAFALAYTGWEEVGKAQLVADFANGMAAETEFEDAFRKHNLKVAYNSRRFVVNIGDVPLSTIEYEPSSAQLLFEGRNASLYVGKESDDSPLKPAELVSEKAATRAVTALRAELENIDRFDALNERIGSASFLK
jgi:AbiV family abortive infection protein